MYFVRRFCIFFILFSLCLQSLSSQEEFGDSAEAIVTVSIHVPEKEDFSKGTFWTVFDFTIPDDWHLYWKNPGSAGFAPEVVWTLPEGIQVSKIAWPAPERFEIGGMVIFGYANRLLLPVELQIAKEAQDKQILNLQADVSWLVCGPACVPEEKAVQAIVHNGPHDKGASFYTLLKKAEKQLPKKTKKIAANLKDNTLEIQLQNIDLDNVVKAKFFPDENRGFLIDEEPTFAFDREKHTLVLTAILQDDFKAPFDAVVVIEDNKNNKTALQITVSEEMLLPKSGEGLFSHDLLTVLGMLFLGGMLLNVVPCVLPVVSIKLLQILQLRDENKQAVTRHGLSFSFGVVSSFWVLALITYVLQRFGRAVGWGFQLQEPFFVLALAVLLFIFSLALLGVFPFGFFVAEKAQTAETLAKKKYKNSHISSFVSGVLATFVGSSCTGPLLGAALGVAVSLDPEYIFLLFSTLGLGMASPYLMLSLFPSLIKLLPRPGAWMETVKQAMGFLMMATVIWLLWVLEAQLPFFNTTIVVFGLLFLAIGCWVHGRWTVAGRAKSVQRFSFVVMLFFVAVSFNILIRHIVDVRYKTAPRITEQNGWEPYSPELLATLREKGTPVFLSIEAKWCLTCQTNHIVLESDAVQKAFQTYGVVLMRADWTIPDPAVTEQIRALGRNGVPVYAFYRDGKKPQLLPELLTKHTVISVLEESKLVNT